MNDDTHIARPKRSGEHRFNEKTREALCGAKAPKDGSLVCGPSSSATCWKCISLRCGRPVPTYPPTPEHERLKAAKSGRDQTQLVGEFLEWLGEQGYVFGRYRKNSDSLTPVHLERNKLLAKFFEIDENALESEKRALLDHMREVHKATEWAKTEGYKVLRGT